MITRRAFGRLLGLIGATAILRVPRPAAAATPLFDIAIAGGSYHALPARRAALRVGMRLLLRREPANPFDPTAVEILDGNGTRLGYVPRAAAGSVAALLDAGAEVEAEVAGALDDDAALAAVTFTDARRGDPRIRLTRLG